METTKATIYRTTMFGVNKTEIHLAGKGIGDYAQYRDVQYLVYKKKGTRRFVKQSFTSREFIVLEGWGHMSPPSGFLDKQPSGTGFAVAISKYAGCDNRYTTDFLKKLVGYRKECNPKILAVGAAYEDVLTSLA